MIFKLVKQGFFFYNYIIWFFDIQSLVQNLLNDLGDVGRQAQVNTTMAVREEELNKS